MEGGAKVHDKKREDWKEKKDEGKWVQRRGAGGLGAMVCGLKRVFVWKRMMKKKELMNEVGGRTRRRARSNAVGGNSVTLLWRRERGRVSGRGGKGGKKGKNVVNCGERWNTGEMEEKGDGEQKEERVSSGKRWRDRSTRERKGGGVELLWTGGKGRGERFLGRPNYRNHIVLLNESPGFQKTWQNSVNSVTSSRNPSHTSVTPSLFRIGVFKWSNVSCS